jgi:cell division protein FtsQ
MGKPETQPGRNPTRFSPSASANDVAFAEDEASEGAFYRPAPKRPVSGRPKLGKVPFRDSQTPQLEDEDDEPFLRSRRRVAVRRGFLPRGRWGRIGYAAGAVALLGALVWLGYAAREFAAHDPRFRIDSSENIQILGNSQVTQPELLSVFGGDMGRNVFFIPLQDRRAELERLPWVQSATVMRLLPDQLRVSVTERTPIAFVRNGNTIGLADREGVLLPMDAKTLAAKHYSFPVITGLAPTDAPSTRAARMKLYQRMIAELDSTGEKLSGQLSEVDLADPEDVKAIVSTQSADGESDLLLHLGDQDFLARWRNYQQHLAEWRAQYPRLASVDLRYERQVVLEMQKGTPPTPNPEAAASGANSAPAQQLVSKPAAHQKAAAKLKTHPLLRSNHLQPGAN